MNLKKKMKGFFTLTRQANGGFTLVELIVVIAILAILAGVAIPVYSGYVTKANMQADMTLVSEVANALTLHYYSDPTNAANGYVVLSMDDADADDAGVGAAAMQKVFGDNWAKTAVLKYDGWTDEGMLDYVLDNKDNASIVANSTYLTNSTPAQLVSAISSVTDAMSTMVAGHAGNPLDKVESLGVLSADQLTAMRAELTALGVSWTEGEDNSAYATAVSNLMVKYVADELGNYDLTDEDAEVSGLASIASVYCAVYALASTGDPDGVALLEEMDAAISAGRGAQAIIDAFDAVSIELGEGGALNDYVEGDTGLADTKAMIAIMGAVSDISDNLSMTEKGLYSSDSIAGLVNNYTSAISAVANLSDEDIVALQALPDGAVAVFIDASGNVSVVPAEAYLAA